MQFDKQQIIQMLREQGDHDRAVRRVGSTPLNSAIAAFCHLGRGGLVWLALAPLVGSGRRPLSRLEGTAISVLAIGSALGGSSAIARTVSRQRPCDRGVRSLIPCPEGGSGARVKGDRRTPVEPGPGKACSGMSASRLSILKVIGGIQIVLLRLIWRTIRAAVEGAKLLSINLLERVSGASSPRQPRPLAFPATTAAVSARRSAVIDQNDVFSRSRLRRGVL